MSKDHQKLIAHLVKVYCYLGFLVGVSDVVAINFCGNVTFIMIKQQNKFVMYAELM